MRKNIFVISEGEPLPLSCSNGRKMRAGTISEMLSNRGNNVTWISSTYMHYQKKYIYNKSTTKEIKDNLVLLLLHSNNGYNKNISLKRIKYCKDLGNSLKKKLKKLNKPDAIYCCWPLIELSYEAVRYGKKNNIPVIIDIRDFWPDIFIQPLPNMVKPLGKLVINSIYRNQVEYTLRNATSVIGVIPYSLDFAKSYGRNIIKEDEIYYLSYKKEELNIVLDQSVRNKLSNLKNSFTISYIGSMINRNANFEYMEELINYYKNNSRIKFAFCGDGSYLDKFKYKHANNKNVIIFGHVNKPVLVEVLKNTEVGLLPYSNTKDFKDSLPNKVGEYLAYGVPIFTTLSGLSKKILEEKNAGFYTPNSKTACNIVDKLLDNGGKLKDMKENVLALFRDEFDANIVYNKLCDKIENIKYKEI